MGCGPVTGNAAASSASDHQDSRPLIGPAWMTKSMGTSKSFSMTKSFTTETSSSPTVWSSCRSRSQMLTSKSRSFGWRRNSRCAKILVHIGEIGIRVAPGEIVPPLMVMLSIESEVRGCFKSRRVRRFGRHTSHLCEDGSNAVNTIRLHWDHLVPMRLLIEGKVTIKATLCDAPAGYWPSTPSSSSASIRATFSATLPYDADMAVARLQLPLVEADSSAWAQAAELFVEVRNHSPIVKMPRLTKAISPSEWNPETDAQWKELWETPWKPQHAGKPEMMLRTLEIEMKRDAVLMYQTLFPPNISSMSLSREESDTHDQQILFMKRLLLSAAVCGLTYCTEENAATTSPWPFPLASALCHGSRILFWLSNVTSQEFINFLLFGSPDAHNWDDCGIPGPFQPRWAASHAVGFNAITSQLFEMKIRKHSPKNISDGLLSHHLGIDIPVGGLGNPAPSEDGNWSGVGGNPARFHVGPNGVPYMTGESLEFRKAPTNLQHGHLYLRWDDFGQTNVPMVVPSLTSSSEGDNPVQDDPSDLNLSEANKSWNGHVAKRSWQYVNGTRSSDEMESFLVSHGMDDLRKGNRDFHRLYSHVAVDKDLSLQTCKWEPGQLRCHGVLLHVVFELASDGYSPSRWLIHTAASAFPDSMEDEDVGDDAMVAFQVSDPHVPTVLRRRNESWAAAVSRHCEVALGLSPSAVQLVVEGCRRNEDEMYVFKAPPFSTVCHTHGAYGDLAVEYEAYRFKFVIEPKHRPHFENMLNSESFRTEERTADLNGFGDSPPGPGLIIREWAWLEWDEAVELGTIGLQPPADALCVTRAPGHISSVLVGIEGSSWGKCNLFGNQHTMMGKSQDRSAFGKRKWREYKSAGLRVPAEIGGMHVAVDRASFILLQDTCEAARLLRPSETGHKSEKAFFQKMLQSSDEQLDEILRDHLNIDRSSTRSCMETQVFDKHVRDFGDSKNLACGHSQSMALTSTTASTRTSTLRSEFGSQMRSSRHSGSSRASDSSVDAVETSQREVPDRPRQESDTKVSL